MRYYASNIPEFCFIIPVNYDKEINKGPPYQIESHHRQELKNKMSSESNRLAPLRSLDIKF